VSNFFDKLKDCSNSTVIVEFTIVFGMLFAAGLVTLRAFASKGALAATTNLLSSLV
jgi:hypothetical protein